MKAWGFKLYCCAILLIVSIPLLGTAANLITNELFHKTFINEAELSGSANVPAEPVLSLEALKSGQFQSEFEDYFSYNLVARKTQTRLYNQLLYTLFHSTSNSDIVVGKDDYIFQIAYPTAYYKELSSNEIIALREKIEKLNRLAELLKERDVLMVVRMSPSKAQHYPEYLPSSYDRFFHMKQNGEYGPNWYQVFREEIEKTDILYYDRYDLIEDLKNNGEIAFTKGGIHWSLAPMAEYINGLNALIEDNLGTKLGRMVVESYEVKTGEMGASADNDIWKLCWNTFYAPPNYPSPHISFGSTPGDAPLRVFTVGQSFTTVLLTTIYGIERPVWDETLFSWYNARVIQFPSELPWGTQISEQTDDYEKYLGMDVILIDFLENGGGDIQFQFVENMLNYLGENPFSGK